jgi:outer membrane protein assembly factor BamB
MDLTPRRHANGRGAVVGVSLMLCAAGCSDILNTGVEGANRVAWKVDVISPSSAGDIAADSANVYVYQSDLGIKAIRLADQRVIWGAIADEPFGGDDPMEGIALCAGRVIFGSYLAAYAVSPATGARLWRWVPLDGGSLGYTVPVCSGNTLYFGTGRPMRVYAVDALTGRQLWSREMTEAVGSNGFVATPRVANGIVLACTREFAIPFRGRVAALDAATGAELWRFQWQPEAPREWASCPFHAALGGGIALASADDGRVFAFDARTGTRLWTLPGDPENISADDQRSLQIIGNTVVVGSLSGSVIGVNLLTGQERWRYSITAGRDLTIMIDGFVADSTMLVGVNSSGWALALNPQTGAALWQVRRGTSLNERAMFGRGVLTKDLFIAIASDGVYAIRR